MTKQLNIDLNFRANTSQAQQQIQQLQSSLTQIAAAGTTGIGGEKIAAEIKQASTAAKELQMHLSKAMNTQTGTLDLNRLNNSLMGAKTNLQTLSNSLLQIGATGTTAFTQLATAISQAERPMLALNGKLTQLWTVMKNTAKWQLSSSMIHGFVGGVSEAYRYAQDLNESLNNIRIVTGYSADYMEDFAIQANKAAKALSTTTNEYAKASLIYFQQGLSDEEVKARTDVTIKMANVSRQNAEVVSDQMTAIWNNFYDGSKSLEYYADVMTALGAKTASSSDEIAGGLEKFAAIGDTIGLSYEYAASALATITANTRQSEEVVGTALKTIFARIQGLKLGETLEDGTEMNKYSEALYKIGVNIFDANNNLKNMDVILKETAAKWDTLTKAQQTATAQTVAGIRQYNQFIALMDNWDDGTSDSMVANLETSYGASGALDEQFDIWAESWEAARNKVTASAEAIYDALLNDEFFIDLNNMFSGLLDSIKGFIDEIGGLKTIMIGAFGLLANYLGNKIQPMINNLKANFQVLFTGASQQAIKLGDTMRQAISSAQSNTKIKIGIAEEQSLQNANDLIIAKNKLSLVNKNLSAEERFLAETELQLIQMEQERAASLALTKEKSIEKTNQLKEELMAEESLLQMQQSSTSNIDKRYQGFQKDFSNAVLEGDDAAMMAASGQLDMIEQHYTGVKEAASSTANTIRNEFIASLEQTNYTIPTTSQLFQAQINELNQIKTSLSNGSIGFQEAKTGIEMYAQTLPKVIMEQKEVRDSYRLMMAAADNPKELAQGLEMFIQNLEKAGISAKDLEKIMRQFGQGGVVDKIKTSFKEQKKVTDELSSSQERLKQAFANFNPIHQFTGIERITAMGSALSSTAMAAMSFKTIFSSFANEDMSFGERLTSSLMALGMLIPSVIGMFNSFGKAIGFANIMQGIHAATTLEEMTATAALTSAESAKQLVQKTGMSLDQAEIAMDKLKVLSQLSKIGSYNTEIQTKYKAIAAEKLGLTSKQIDIITTELQSGATLKQALTTAGATGVLKLNTKAIWGNVAATWAWLWPILAVVAAIGLIVAAVKLSIDAYNADAKAAEAAADAAKTAGEEFENAREKYENFKNSLSGYKEAEQGLKNLTKGTIEYKEQLMKVNEEAMKLIDSQNLMYGTDYTYDADGKIEFNDGVLEREREENFNQMQATQANKQFADQRAKAAETKANLTEYNRKELTSGWDATSAIAEGAAFAAAGAGLGALLGTVVPAIGNAIGAVGGAIIGGVIGLGAGIYEAASTMGASTEQEEKAMTLLAEKYSQIGDAALTPEKIKEALADQEIDQVVIDRLINAAENNAEALRTQLSAMNENTAALRGMIEATAGYTNQDNAAYQGLTDKEQSIANKVIANRVDDALVDKDSQEYADAKEAAVKAWQEETKQTRGSSEKGFFKGDETATYDKYMEITYGKNWRDNYKVENMGGTNATIMKKNEDGKWENIDPDNKKNTLSNAEVEEALVKWYASQYSEADKKVMENLQAVGDAMENAIPNIDDDAIFDVQSALAEGGMVDLTLMSPEQVKALEEEINSSSTKISEDYKEAIIAGINQYSEEAHKARLEAEASNIIDAGARELETTTGALEAYTAELMENNEELAKNKKLAAELAVETFRFSKQLDKLEKVVKDNIKNIKNFNKNSLDCYESLGKVQEALEETFGLDVSSDFIKKNIDLISSAAEGSQEAIKNLGIAISKDYIKNLEIADENISAFFNEELNNGEGLQIGDNVYASLDEFTNHFNTAKQNVLGYIDEISNANLKIGDSLSNALGPEDMSNFVGSLNEMAVATKMSVEDMKAMLTDMGVQAKVEQKWVPGTVKVPIYETTEEILHDGTGFFGDDRRVVRTSTRQVDEQEMPGGQYVASISYDGTKPDVPQITYTGAPKALTTTGNGSGGNKSKTIQKKAPIKAKDEEEDVERYHEINKKIEDQERILNRLSKVKDKAYGLEKIKIMDKEIAALKKMNELDNQRLGQIREKLALDKELAHNYGVNFDEFGRISNYEEIISIKKDLWKAEQDAIQKEEIAYEEKKNNDENYDEDGSIKLDIETRKEESNENYEKFIESMSRYEETATLFEDAIDAMQDRWDQIADTIVEKITSEVENRLDFNEFTLELLDFQISSLGESFSNFSEITAFASDKLFSLDDSIDALSEGITKLNGKYQMGKISFSKYVQELDTQLQNIFSQMQSFIELDKEMMEYYASAFDAAEEEFTGYLDLIDYGIGKLDHFKNMLSLIGKENNKEMLDAVLQAQYTTASNRLTASSNWYSVAKGEYDALYAKWQAEKDTMGEKELELLEKQLETARIKMNEADEQRLADLEVVGEKAQEILQNNLDMAREKLEKSLVGSSLDDYMTNLDRLSRKQEEYLTNTNKLYETNKLIRQAQQEMDKTENARAKQQYSDYVKYIEQLQESGQLSQYELSIAQAKYELLQAQIALEEAQDAKNQVRLTRDAEGNYGYVYTANEDKVADAEQAVADAENKLYNIGLDGAQDYQSKKAEILQEAIDTFASIEEQYQTGQIKTEEEFNQKMQEAKTYYYDMLKGYDELYYLALGTMQEESYGNTLDYELDSTNVFSTFENSVNTYLSEVQNHFDDYDTKVQVVEDEVGTSLDELKNKTSDVTTETSILTEKTNDLVSEMSDEFWAIRNVTSEWGKHRDRLYENIEANRILIDQLREIQKLAMGTTQDYAAYLKELVSKGGTYDNRLVQQVLSQRWEKMGGQDNNDYQKMINDYVAQYASENGLSIEEAEAALQNDAWYKTLKMLRQYKIERTDWSAVKASILAENPEADTAWVDDLREEKLQIDWESRIRKYVGQNAGITLDDSYLQEMLGIRQAQIDARGGAESGMISNEDLIKELSSGEGAPLIDSRHTPDQAATDPGSPQYTDTYVALSEAERNNYAELMAKGQIDDATLRARGISPTDREAIAKKAKALQDQGGEEPSPSSEDDKGKDTPADTTNNKTPPAKETPLAAWQISQYATDITRGTDFIGQNDTEIKASLRQRGVSNADIDKIFAEVDEIRNPPAPKLKTFQLTQPQKTFKYTVGPSQSAPNLISKTINGIKYQSPDNGTTWYAKSSSTVVPNTGNRVWDFTLSESYAYLNTGGYTGEWGPEGKLAVLHEKEIVLNKHDTENFLIGIDMLRSISDMLDKNALVQSIGMITSDYLTTMTDHSNILQQEVTIHADFPNVQDHNEIEIAIDNLINAASQHAYKI